MKPRCLFPICSVVVTLLIGACPLLADVILLERSSFINASDFGSGGGFDQQEFTEFGTFTGTAAIGDITVRQTSTVTESIFGIEAFADGGAADTFDIEAFSLLRVEFDVTTTSFYSLQGLLEELDPSGSSSNTTFVRLLDRNKVGNLATVIQFSSDANSSVELTSTGVLQPGEYTFDFESRSFGFSSVLTSDVSFSISSVPEPSSFAVVVGISLAATAWRRRITIKRRS